MAHLVWPGEPGVLGTHLRVAEQLAGLQGVAVVHLVLQPDQGESVPQFLAAKAAIKVVIYVS